MNYTVSMNSGIDGHCGSGEALSDAVVELMLAVEAQGTDYERRKMLDQIDSWRDAVMEDLIVKGEVQRVRFKTGTERLNSEMRTVIDALRSQIMDNPAAPERLRDALAALNEAAVIFTGMLYTAGEARDGLGA